MHLLDPIVERTLRRTAGRWKWLRFLQHAATLACAVTLLVLLVGVLRTIDWIASPTAASVLIIVLVVVSAPACLLMGLVMAASSEDRRWLAAQLERVHRPLLDRLNTLVHLEHTTHADRDRAYGDRIERQARSLLVHEPPPPPFSPTRPLLHLLAFLAILLATVAFFQRFGPLRPVPTLTPPPVPLAQEEQPLEMPPPESEVVERATAWGEVRITDPARDLVVTRVETVPLQIEAAASQPLRSIEWVTAVNGGEEQAHALPAPAEPRYAAYNPVIRVEDFKLDDWDVLTYFARAATDTGEQFRSEVYFLEVQPFREELLKSAGSGKCYSLLSELTGMIEQQREIIRETYRSTRLPEAQTEMRDRLERQLADYESELADAAEHLAARLASEFDEGLPRDSLEHLSGAESSLRRAADSLKDGAGEESVRAERSALSELAAARKQFQRLVADHPEKFAEPEPSEPPPELADMLERIAEFRDEVKAAQEFVQKAIDQQRDIAKRAGTGHHQPNQPLADEQDKLRQSLDEFRQQHPRPFRGSDKEAAACQSAMNQSAAAIRQGSHDMRTLPGNAANQMEALRDAMQAGTHRQQLADAYRLKKMLDELTRRLGQLESQPDSMIDGQTKQAAADAERLAQELQRLAETKPTSDDFAQDLRDALNDERQQQLESQCQALGQAQGGEARSRAAGDLKRSLEQLAEAFARSQPQALAELSRTDVLKAIGEEALQRGLRQLHGLAQDAQGERPLSPQDQARQRAEALENLRNGVFGLWGYNEQSQRLVGDLERDLPDLEIPVNAQLIERLMRELEKRRVESLATTQERPDESPTTFIDPARLPPAYRPLIEKYFEKLSEQK